MLQRYENNLIPPNKNQYIFILIFIFVLFYYYTLYNANNIKFLISVILYKIYNESPGVGTAAKSLILVILYNG